MFFELSIIRHLITQLRSRLQVLRADPEAGYSTEAVVVIALLVAMAITAVGIIAAKVISTAHNISTGGGSGGWTGAPWVPSAVGETSAARPPPSS